MTDLVGFLIGQLAIGRAYGWRYRSAWPDHLHTVHVTGGALQDGHTIASVEVAIVSDIHLLAYISLCSSCTEAKYCCHMTESKFHNSPSHFVQTDALAQRKFRQSPYRLRIPMR